MPQERQNSEDPNKFLFYAQTAETATPDGRVREGYALTNMNDDEIRAKLGEVAGVDPRGIHLGDDATRSSRRVFGVPNWDRCNWRPEGPNSDPTNN